MIAERAAFNAKVRLAQRPHRSGREALGFPEDARH